MDWISEQFLTLELPIFIRLTNAVCLKFQGNFQLPVFPEVFLLFEKNIKLRQRRIKPFDLKISLRVV